MKSSLHSRISFLTLFCNYQLNSAHISAGWRLKTRLNFMLLLPASEILRITTFHGPHRKYSLSVVGKACLQRCCIEMEVTRLLFVYSLPRECVYQVVALQWTSPLISLFRISGAMSHYFMHILLISSLTFGPSCCNELLCPSIHLHILSY
jgi:hypothetical protein